MSAQGWILVMTAVLAAVAICAAVVAVRAVSRLSQAPAPVAAPAPTPRAEVMVREAVVTVLPSELEPRVVGGRLVVPPTQHQVVQAALGRPGVRASILVHGVAHAMRSESRDRISALMRREYRRRRRERQQAGRRAVRAAQPNTSADPWTGS